MQKPRLPRARIVKKAYLYMNNHFAAKSVANAVVVKHLTGEPVEGEYPQAHDRSLRGPRAPRQGHSIMDRPTSARDRGCDAPLLDERPRRR